MTQKGLAAACGWQGTRLSGYETARKWPDEATQELLVSRLKISRACLERTWRLLYEILESHEDGEKLAPQETVPPFEGYVQETPARLPEDLDQSWQELRRAEQALRQRRDDLRWRTEKILLENALSSFDGRR